MKTLLEQNPGLEADDVLEPVSFLHKKVRPEISLLILKYIKFIPLIVEFKGTVQHKRSPLLILKYIHKVYSTYCRV